MTNEQKFILQLIEGFTKQKGRGSCYAYPPLKPENIVISFINLHRQKRQDTTILIVVRDYEERLKIKALLEKYNLIDKVTILTKTYLNTNYNYNYTFTFIIGMNEYAYVQHLYSQSKFTFLIMTEQNNQYLFKNILPIITPNVTFSDLSKDRLKYPVEETWIPIEISEDDKTQLEKYDEYIGISMRIFGEFENADKCRIGDAQTNTSAGEFRYNLARMNGWSETLDTTVDYNKQLDEIYNPNSLYERANTLYGIIRERLNLVTDNRAKLNTIVDIINNNPDKKILIVSKRGEFANEIANYINENTEYICGEYHDCIPEQYVDDEYGKPITYKSGENKGKPKLFKSKALSTMALNRFNSSDKSLSINLLSIKNSSDVELKTAIDLIIFTSSVCLSPNDFIQRFDKVEFTSNPLSTFVVYCSGTIEENKLSDRKMTNNVKLIEYEKNVQIDLENGEVYL